MSLPCCRPTAYDGGSQTVVHSLLCDKADQPLTPAEYAEWRGHPLTYKASHLKVVDAPTPPVAERRKRRPLRREWWNLGFRDPSWEDFS